MKVATVSISCPIFAKSYPMNCESIISSRRICTVDSGVLCKGRVGVPHNAATYAEKSLKQSMLHNMIKSSVFWPGITPTIKKLRARCSPCNVTAPSQSSAPLQINLPLHTHFNAHFCGFFHHKAANYLVVVDRYFNWPIVERASGGSWDWS